MAKNKEKEKKKFRIGNFLKGLGKPLGGILGIAGKLTGIDALDKIGDAISGNTELSEVEKEQAMEIINQDRIAYYDDLANARQMQVDIATSANSTKLAKNFVYYFSTFWSIIGAGFVIATLFVTVPEDNVRLVDTAFGFLLGTALAQMFGFFLGSSEGSKAKTQDLISKLND